MNRKRRAGNAFGIAPKLAILARQLLKREAEDLPDERGEAADLVPMAEFIRSCRRLRDEMFGVDFFGDPAWDILLDLYIGLSGNRVARVDNLSDNTVLRWINVLEVEGLVCRDDPEADFRLTGKGMTLMHDYLERAVRVG